MCLSIAQSVSGTCDRLHRMKGVSKYSKEVNILMKRFELVFVSCFLTHSYIETNVNLSVLIAVWCIFVCYQH